MARIKEFATVLLMAAAPAMAQDNAAGLGSAGEGRRLGVEVREAQEKARTGGVAGREGQVGGQRAGVAGMANFDDRLFVQAAQESGIAEVLVSQLAIERASSDRVKQFAQRMVDEHTRANQQLQEQARDIGGGRGAGQLGATGTRDPQVGRTSGQEEVGRAGDAQPGARDTTTTQDRTGTQTGAAGTTIRGGAGGQVTAQVGMLSPGKRAEYAILASKQGAEFDRCYIQQQVAAHMCAVALYKAQSEMGQDENLKSFAAQTLPKLTDHLETATSILRETSDAGGQTPQGGSQIQDRSRTQDADRSR